MNRTDFNRLLAALVLAGTGWLALPCASGQAPDPALERARQLARSDDRDKRCRAFTALIAAGDEGRSLLRPLLRRRFAREVRRLRGFMRSPAGRRLRKLAASRLGEARREALATIYDPSIYPDENHGAAGQPIVDEKVSKVRALWEAPVQALRHEVAPLDRLLRDLDLSYRFLAPAGLAPPPDLPDLAACLTHLNRAADLPSVGGGSRRARREEQVRAALRQVEAEASPGEIKVVVLLNDYRRMMGRLPLAPHLLLMRAARKHSLEMEELGYFSHTSPTPEGRTPSMRAAREGYGGGCAENIARAASPEGAHRGWYHSAGHHRNMLGRHHVIGVGQSRSGGYWTEMFGSGGLPDDPKPGAPPGWLTYLKRAAAIPDRDLDSHRALARWCRENGLYRAMEREARRVLATRPDDEATRKLLDETRQGEQWMHPVDRRAATAGPPAAKIKALSLLLGDADPYRRLRAVRALAALFDPGAERWLIRALRDGHPDVRIEACLGLMAGIGKAVEPALRARLKDPQPRVRHFAAAALYRRGNAAGVRALLEDLKEGTGAVRASAQEALRFIAHQDFGYAWSDSEARRAEAIARALAWFRSQVDGFGVPRSAAPPRAGARGKPDPG